MPLTFKSVSEIEAGLGIKQGGAVHQWFTNTCALHMDKYVPFDEGTLAQTVVNNGVINTANVNEDTIIYNQPYATYVYNGMRQDGSHVIKHYTKREHPLATSYWDKKMWTAERYLVEKEVQKYMEMKR